MSRKPSEPEWGPSFERNRYFTGKYMTARDFAADQEYLLSRRNIHNRLLHGWGVVCGLRVVPHPNPECRERWVVVKAGIAIDCHGREVFLPKDVALELPDGEVPVFDPEEVDERQLSSVEHEAPAPFFDDDEDDDEDDDDEDIPEMDELWHRSPTATPSWPRRGLLVCLKYGEQLVEQVPALYSEGNCDPTHFEANRIREVGELTFKRLDEVHDDCWRVPGGGDVRSCDDCDQPVPGPSGVCLDVDCPCCGCIPLALVIAKSRCREGETRLVIDHRGRRRLPTPSHYLTHVSHINWPHGGTLTLRQMRRLMHGRLVVRFDRKIRPAVAQRSGINNCTFIVEYGGIQKALEFLHSEEDPYLLDDERTAVFKIHRDYISRRQRESIAGTTVYITLKCDFIFDCHDIPVDGNHLGGRLPSGDGNPGGVFHSWFHVVHSRPGRENDR